MYCNKDRQDKFYCYLQRGHKGKCKKRVGVAKNPPRRCIKRKGSVRCILQMHHGGEHRFAPAGTTLQELFDVVTHASGRVSSRILGFHRIPRAALVALASRFDRGVRLKGEAAWNAEVPCDKHEATMKDRAFLVERLGHGIDHCYKALARLQGLLPPLDEQDENDGGDAGAIMFAGALLAAVKEWERLHPVEPAK